MVRFIYNVYKDGVLDFSVKRVILISRDPENKLVLI